MPCEAYLCKMQNKCDILVIGGGAAGFFTAIRCAELTPSAKIILLEKGKKVLQKVKISGGGRCNVTHACWEPKELVTHYPRGKKELLGPFHQFACGDTMDWFETRGVPLKIEDDGRVFPQSNSSQSIIDCLWDQVRKAKIEVRTQQDVVDLKAPSSDYKRWKVKTRNGELYEANQVMCCTGSSPRIWELLKQLGHQIVAPVPSLFTFNIKDKRIHGIPGISMPKTRLKIVDSKLEAAGPLLVTHWGLSGPAILKLSAWGARSLAERNYDFKLIVNWLANESDIESQLNSAKKKQAKKQVANKALFGLPNRLWQRLISAAKIYKENWGDLNKQQLQQLNQELTAGIYQVNGKSTFKDEFVTAGGIDLKEVNFKTFESKLFPGLYFAGEVLNIDAITGGFNFQAAWTGGWIAGGAMSV